MVSNLHYNIDGVPVLKEWCRTHLSGIVGSGDFTTCVRVFIDSGLNQGPGYNRSPAAIQIQRTPTQQNQVLTVSSIVIYNNYSKKSI